MDDTWYAKLFNSSRQLTYKKGEMIHHPFDIPQGVYCVAEGLIKAYSVTKAGSEHIYVNLISGEIFPLAWAALDTSTDLYYSALTDCRLLRISRDEFSVRVKADAETGYTLFQHTVSQYLTLVDRLNNMEYNYASERVVYRLLFLGGRVGERQADGSVIISSLTQRDIAHSINLTPESLSREFDKLRQKGLVRTSGKSIILCDTEKLASEVDQDEPVIAREAHTVFSWNQASK